MRRFIAYIAMAITALICVGVAFTPVFTQMKPGREFTTGNEIVYKISETEEPERELSNDVAEKVATEMRSRLETYKIEDYSVKVEGNDTVRVSLSVKSESQLNYISKYLSFNGKNFSLAGAEEETRVTGDKIFVNTEAYILRKEDIVPYVIIPVSDTAAVKTLIEAVQKEEQEEQHEESAIHVKRAGETAGEGEEEPKSPDIFLWANHVEGDTYEKAQKDQAITGQKILMQFVSDNIWYTDDLKEDEEPSKLQFLCGYAKEGGSDYDTDKLREANELATYLVNMLNAPAFTFADKNYTVENWFVSQSASGVTNNQITTQPTAESLLVFGTDINVRLSTTLIATFVAIAIVFLILVLFYRVAALGIIASVLGSTFLGYTIFFAMGATFNVAAIIGGILVAASSLVVSVLYMNKLKEEVYKGRALRKAHQEGMKKINLPSIDVAVVLAFAGLMIYFLGGHALKPLGILIFFGGIMSLLVTQIIFRIMMWLLTNSTSMQTNFKALNIDEKLVPNIMQEEKSTYVAPYENTNFTSKKKPVAIVAGIVAVASIALISVFGVLKGSPLNVSNATRDTTQIYTSIQLDNPQLSTEQLFKDDVLAKVYINGKPLAYQNVTVTNRETYDYETDITTKEIYFVTSIDSTFKVEDKVEVKVSDTLMEPYDNVESAISAIVYTIEGESSVEYSETRALVSHETVTTPHQGYVALACAISIVGLTLYYSLRYRPSRGFAALAVSSVTTLITFGIFVMCRIQTTAICSFVMPIATVLSLVFCMLFFEKEKSLSKEVKGELKPEVRKSIMVKASSLCAAPLFISSILTAYISINYFGFGYKSFAIIFAGMLLSIVLSALFVTTLLGPTSELFSKLFKHIKLPTIKIDRAKRQRIKLQGKPKTSEPEETTFIGIND